MLGRAASDDQVRLLEPAGQRVQVREAGADAADLALVLVQVVQPVVGGVQQRLQRREAALDALLADREELLLRPVDGLADVRRVVVADGGDPAGRADQVAQDRLALDDAAVVDGVDRGGRQVDEAGQVGRAADLLQRRRCRSSDLRDGDDVHRLAPLVQLQDGPVDGAMCLAVEVLRPQEVRDLDDRVTVDQQGAQHRLLGLDGLRRQAVDGQRRSPGGWTGRNGLHDPACHTTACTDNLRPPTSGALCDSVDGPALAVSQPPVRSTGAD